MSPRPTRDMAASVKQRLLNLAKERAEDFNFVLGRFAVERFLFRLSRSEYRDDFVLKGAMLFSLLSIRMTSIGQTDPSLQGGAPGPKQIAHPEPLRKKNVRRALGRRFRPIREEHTARAQIG